MDGLPAGHSCSNLPALSLSKGGLRLATVAIRVTLKALTAPPSHVHAAFPGPAVPEMALGRR